MSPYSKTQCRGHKATICKDRKQSPHQLEHLKGQSFKSGSGQEFEGNKNLNPKIEARPCQGFNLSSERFVILSQPYHVLMKGLGGEARVGREPKGFILTL